MDQSDRDGVQEVQFLSPGSVGNSETCVFEHTQMFHHPEARHLHHSREV
jgi:hypothetical protein